jgi:hypothetical protein
MTLRIGNPNMPHLLKALTLAASTVFALTSIKRGIRAFA